MKFFIDSVDIQAIKKFTLSGMVDGVTTNPSIIAKSGKDFKEVIREICEIVPGPVSAEVTATDARLMVEEDDIGEDGMDLIRDIRTIYNNYPSLNTEILAASIRSAEHVKRAAVVGADISTLPPSVLNELAQHSLTDKGLKAFLDDWEKTGQKIL